VGVLEVFAALFEGRKDAYGTADGGCRHVESTIHSDEHWVDSVEDHLSGRRPLGVYPLVPFHDGVRCDNAIDRNLWCDDDWAVKWGCVDFDVAAPGKRAYDYDTIDEGHAAAVALKRVLRRMGLVGWIERTRSDGRHVWVFARGWVPAATMRRALLVACDVAVVSKREVNPKSEGFGDPTALGNYVRLPFPGFLSAHRKQPLHQSIIIESAETFGWEKFLEHAMIMRAPIKVLDDAARLWKPPPPPKPIEPATTYGGGRGHLLHRLSKPGRAVFYDGPLDGDRSEGLFYLAGECKDSGLTPHEALVLVTDADARWGKFSKRRDGEKQLQRTVERAYR
jgi:hypothetical protein